jgi:hypothetical protein
MQTVKLNPPFVIALGLMELLDDQLRKFQDKLINAGDRELAPMGVVLLILQAMYDEMGDMKGIDHPMQNMLYLIMNSVIDAIVADDADLVKKTWATAVQEIKEEKSPITKALAEIDYKTFEAVQRLGSIIHQCALSAEYWMEERRDESVNPYYNQLAEGIILEYSYGLPGDIYTSIGEFKVRGSCGGSHDSSQTVHVALQSHPDIDIELFEEERITRQGQFGPWYAIRRIGKMEFPAPVKRKKEEYAEYAPCSSLWEKFQGMYVARNLIRDENFKLVKNLVNIKEYPDTKEAIAYKGQPAHVVRVHRDGTCEVIPMSAYKHRGGVAIRVPFTDLYIFKSGMVK